MTSTGRTTRGLNRVPGIAPPETGGTGRTATRKEPVQEKRRKKIKFKLFALGAGLDTPLLFLILILLSIGLVMLFSASYANCYYLYGDSYYYIKRQAAFAIAGVVIMLVVSTFDYHQFHKLAFPLFGITILFLVMVLAFKGTAIAPVKNSANRWLNFGFVEFQPSEIAKFSLIVLYAHLISQRIGKMHTFKDGFLPFMGVLGVFAILIVLEKHVSATIIIVLISFILMFIGGTKPKWFLMIGGAGGAVLAAALLFSSKFAYAMDRIHGWLDPFNPPAGVDTWQTRQSLYAIGSGQFLGVGLGQSRQKYLYLPEPQNDFIFAVVCEELGFIGALIIIIIFALLIWRGIYVSLHAKDKFGMMMGLGITFQIGIQIVLNICVVTNTIPNTGISLPFFSYGGTALIILLAEMGVLLQISRSSNIEKT